MIAIAARTWIVALFVGTLTTVVTDSAFAQTQFKPGFNRMGERLAAVAPREEYPVPVQGRQLRDSERRNSIDGPPTDATPVVSGG